MGKHAGFRREIASKLYEALLLDDRDLRSTLASIDPSGDGRVSVEELQAVLSRVLPCVTPDQCWTMLRTIVDHRNPDGTVSVYEFLESFQLRFASTFAKPAPPDAAWIPSLLPKIGLDIVQQGRLAQQTSGRLGLYQTTGSLGQTTGSTASGRVGLNSFSSVAKLLTEFFEAKDTSRSGYLEYGELVTALQGLPSCQGLSMENVAAVAQFCDLTGSGRVNYLEFLTDFSVEAGHSMAEKLHEDHLESIYRALFFNLKGVVAQVLEQYIVPGQQRCTPEEFLKALCAANASQRLLTDDQLAVLVDTLSVDADGCFDFREYFASFKIVDTALGIAGEEESLEQ